MYGDFQISELVPQEGFVIQQFRTHAQVAFRIGILKRNIYHGLTHIWGGACLVPRRLSFDENVRAKEGGKDTTRLLSLPFPWSLAVHHQSLVSRSPLLCEKPKRLRRRLGRCYHFRKKSTPKSNDAKNKLILESTVTWVKHRSCSEPWAPKAIQYHC